MSLSDSYRSVAASLVILIAACTSQTVNTPTTAPSESTTSTTLSPEPTVTPNGSDWLPRSAGIPDQWMNALLLGVLHIDVANRCVTVHRQESDVFAVVWVDGTTLDLTDQDAPVLVLPNGERLEEGASVALGGGSWGADPEFADRGPFYREVEIPATCQADAVWIAAP